MRENDVKKTVCFGELMGRLNPEGYFRLVQAQKLELSFAGGEANVAVSLSYLGLPSSYVTRLPRNDLGRAAMMELSRYQVDCSDICWGGNRLGLYFVEKGASQRASKVIYDRAHSAIAEASREDFDWAKILEGAAWFHFTGITPALGGQLPEICMDALEAAKRAGVTVSCDLNYRKNLWSRELAGEVMAKYMPYVDLLIANEEDAADVFGVRAAGSEIEKGQLSQEGYADVARQLSERFGIGKIAITLRGSISASDNEWGALLYEGGEARFSKRYRVHIVDRVGGGDSFGAGLIYATQMGYEPQRAVEFAAAASCLKHSIEHDFNLVTTDEIEKLAQGDGSGRVQR
jgi:2-dehydro-3-deoxygluconokinase